MKIYGTGKPSKKTGKVHLPKGVMYEVDEAMGKILIEAGRATEEAPEKEKKETVSAEKEKVVIENKKEKRVK